MKIHWGWTLVVFGAGVWLGPKILPKVKSASASR
jgi:hypothetical protein